MSAIQNLLDILDLEPLEVNLFRGRFGHAPGGSSGARDSEVSYVRPHELAVLPQPTEGSVAVTLSQAPATAEPAADAPVASPAPSLQPTVVPAPVSAAPSAAVQNVRVYRDERGFKLQVDGRDVLLMLWDLHGEDEFQSVRISYLRGSSGHLLVADGTRRETLQRAYALQPTMDKGVPFVLLLNKADLESQWAITDADLDEAKQRGWTILKTSAKTGVGVEEAFVSLARRMMG